MTGPRDAIVIAIYLGLLFGAGVSIATFAASLARASLVTERLLGARGACREPRRRGNGHLLWPISRCGGAAQTPDSDGPRHGWTAFALAVAVGDQPARSVT